MRLADFTPTRSSGYAMKRGITARSHLRAKLFEPPKLAIAAVSLGAQRDLPGIEVQEIIVRCADESHPWF